MQAVFRGGMASLIYHHALSTKDTDNDLEAITLMSNDIDIINGNLEMVMELWAYFIEVVIGVWLLWRRLGWVALLPTLLILACSHWQIVIGKAMSKRRAVWTAAIQKRVGLTSNLLRSMKSIKLSGMVETAAKLVQGERLKELDLGKSYRWMITWMNGFGKILQSVYLSITR
jgi:ATP-binding cassette, subfamily C (CFTR/MRP), member 1